ncbi:MAG: COG1615 family transporter [Firmicutes bacterium]|nr:COG1615 family transporter [Bacillota bacterium]
MMSLLVARNDGEHYGELVLYQLPKSKITYGPMQIEAQIDQNTEISKEFSLWNSSGSTYTRGNMFVIPIEDSLIYVEPVYIEASNSAIPEVKRVIVAYNDKIAYEPTLAEALASLFGKSDNQQQGPGVTPGTTDEPHELTQAELINLANEAFDNAQAAMQNGNWAKYGEYLTQLETYLNMLAQ